MSVLFGTHFYIGGPDATVRQRKALDALSRLNDASAIHLDWIDVPEIPSPGVRALRVLRRDSRSVSGSAGQRKPVVNEMLDALAATAAEEGHRYFGFFNSDIVISPQAVELIHTEGRQAYAFSRMEVSPETGGDLQVNVYGLDLFVFDVGWWMAHRRRFRSYILGEAAWDNVYTSVLMCHADGLIVNREETVRHDVHPRAWGRSAFADYNSFLASLDSRYFLLWATYCSRLLEARGRGASQAEERAIQTDTFVWRRSASAAAWHAGRMLKARWRFQRQRAYWARQSAPATSAA
jgi:hypothetical protein